jgi:hypothetical protein
LKNGRHGPIERKKKVEKLPACPPLVPRYCSRLPARREPRGYVRVPAFQPGISRKCTRQGPPRYRLVCRSDRSTNLIYCRGYPTVTRFAAALALPVRATPKQAAAPCETHKPSGVENFLMSSSTHPPLPYVMSHVPRFFYPCPLQQGTGHVHGVPQRALR